MGFEFWLNGVKYDYASLKTVSISVDKHDLEHGDMFEHTVIKIDTRKEFEEVKESDLPELEEIKDEPLCPICKKGYMAKSIRSGYLRCDICLNAVEI
jgi:hypothetical protein